MTVSNDLPPLVKHYLDKYSTATHSLQEEISERFNYIVVIPSLAETSNLKSLFLSILKNNKYLIKDFLFIVVINSPSNASDDIRENNFRSICLLKEIMNEQIINLGFIDAYTPGNEMPTKEAGVGLARKIGMDEALKYFDYSNKKKNILICLDADCTVNSKYIETYHNLGNDLTFHAGYTSYEHPSDESTPEGRGILYYEIFLRYYVAGLIYSNSPYAFHTVGSTMTCTPDAYIKIEGMNKRKAGEDFYFLEKLSKQFIIKFISGAIVYPSPRKSFRVPFGTGRSIAKFIDSFEQIPELYNPEVFTVLKKWNECFYNSSSTCINSYLIESKNISPQLYRFLISQGFLESLEKICRNSKSPLQFYKQKQQWFDGFRTMKLIHFLRDSQFGYMEMFSALRSFFKMYPIECNFDDKSANSMSFFEKTEYLQLLKYLDRDLK